AVARQDLPIDARVGGLIGNRDARLARAADHDGRRQASARRRPAAADRIDDAGQRLVADRAAMSESVVVLRPDAPLRRPIRNVVHRIRNSWRPLCRIYSEAPMAEDIATQYSSTNT